MNLIEHSDNEIPVYGGNLMLWITSYIMYVKRTKKLGLRKSPLNP